VSFPAAYAGVCSDCGDRFDEGDHIERKDTGWGHAVCPDALALKPGEVVCQDCWITPCVC
jgi:hypothetical protein